VRRAGARGAIRSLLEIHRDKSGGWQRHKWLLAVRYPEHFTERGRFEHSGPGGDPIEIRAETDWDLRKLSNDELDLLYRLQRKAAPDDG
jgi:hypothetical protein